MARKSANGTNLSQQIRDYLKTHRRAKPKQVVAAFAEQGVTVLPQYVSTVKTNAKKLKKKRGTSAKATPSDSVSISTLLQAKKLAEQLGGVAEAKLALDALARLQ